MGEKSDFIDLCELLEFPPEMIRSLKHSMGSMANDGIREEMEEMHRFLHDRGYKCYGQCDCGGEQNDRKNNNRQFDNVSCQQENRVAGDAEQRIAGSNDDLNA